MSDVWFWLWVHILSFGSSIHLLSTFVKLRLNKKTRLHQSKRVFCYSQVFKVQSVSVELFTVLDGPKEISSAITQIEFFVFPSLSW